MKTELLKQKQIRLDIIKSILGAMETYYQYELCDFREVGKEQVKIYNRETKEWEKQYDENGNPEMRSIFDYVELEEDDLDETQKLKLNEFNKVMKELEKLL